MMRMGTPLAIAIIASIFLWYGWTNTIAIAFVSGLWLLWMSSWMWPVMSFLPLQKWHSRFQILLSWMFVAAAVWGMQNVSTSLISAIQLMDWSKNQYPLIVSSSLGLLLLFGLVFGFAVQKQWSILPTLRGCIVLFGMECFWLIGTMTILNSENPLWLDLLNQWNLQENLILAIYWCIFIGNLIDGIALIFWKGTAWSQPLLMSLLFSRFHIGRSIFDRLERLFGIDIQGTWAIQYIRQSLEPLFLSMLLLSWLSTSLVVLDSSEQGLRYSFGVAESEILDSGLHLAWPWPLGKIVGVPTYRVLQMKIGHQSPDSENLAQENAFESILWANQHSDEEFLLLLGDGRDVISADGFVEYRIVEPKTYLLQSQNPEDLLESVVYRVLMHETASRTLDEALSENLMTLSTEVTQKIQQEIQDLNIGIEVLLFTFTALHPPVAVAESYQQVVSAQIDQVTKVLRAEGYQMQWVPKIQAEHYTALSKAEQNAMLQIAQAKGEAYAFEALRNTVRGNEKLYRFRLKQENLQENLQGKSLMIIDHRLEEQGADLWIE